MVNPETVSIYEPQQDIPLKSDEYHVASFVAHAQLDLVDLVKSDISQMDGAEIHADDGNGKIVFTIEASSQGQIGASIDQLKYHTGLYSLSPVYHQFVTEE